MGKYPILNLYHKLSIIIAFLIAVGGFFWSLEAANQDVFTFRGTIEEEFRLGVFVGLYLIVLFYALIVLVGAEVIRVLVIMAGHLGEIESLTRWQSDLMHKQANQRPNNPPAVTSGDRPGGEPHIPLPPSS